MLQSARTAVAADMVNSPSHYQSAAGYEAVDVVERYGLDRYWHLADALVYLLRAGRKGELAEDLRKAQWYLRRFLRNRTMLAAGPLHGCRYWKPAETILADFALAPDSGHGSAVQHLLLGAELGNAGRILDALDALDRAVLDAERKTAILVNSNDPRWAAWLCHTLAQGDEPEASRASDTRRMRRSFYIPSDWPPPSLEVQILSRASVSVPHGTPEHAAWCSHMRGRGEVDLAQSYEMSRKKLLRPSRWPVL